MGSRFVTGRLSDGTIAWACIDELALCTSPAIGQRRFQAYLAPWPDESDARQALLEAGANPATITADRRSKRGQ